MTVPSLSHPNATSTGLLDALRIPPLSHAEAGALQAAELDRFLELITRLDPKDWERPTMCTLWTVKDIVAHQAGSYAAFASRREFFRQNGRRPQKGRPIEDIINEIQVSDRAERTPQELIAELREVGPKAVAKRQSLPALVRMVRLPLPGPLFLKRVDYLTNQIYLFDTWIHRLDICAATGREMLMTPEHDGRIVALVVRELAAGLARKLGGASVIYNLLGPAGGTFRIGAAPNPSATIHIDTIEFNILASCRTTPQQACATCTIEGDAALAEQALNNTSVVY